LFGGRRRASSPKGGRDAKPSLFLKRAPKQNLRRKKGRGGIIIITLSLLKGRGGVMGCTLRAKKNPRIAYFYEGMGESCLSKGWSANVNSNKTKKCPVSTPRRKKLRELLTPTPPQQKRIRRSE